MTYLDRLTVTKLSGPCLDRRTVTKPRLNRTYHASPRKTPTAKPLRDLSQRTEPNLDRRNLADRTTPDQTSTDRNLTAVTDPAPPEQTVPNPTPTAMPNQTLTNLV